MNQFDFNRPITKTRDEVLLVKYHGCIKNVGEMMYKAARALPNFKEYWLDKYIKFHELDGKTDEEIFNLLAPFTSAEFLKYMCLSIKHFRNADAKKAVEDYAKLISLCNPYNAATTNMELMFRQMATYPFCKHIYIYDLKFTEASKKYLRELFANNLGKVSMLEGTLSEILDEKTDITTIFSDSVEEVCTLIQSVPQDSGKFMKKLFMISALPNAILDENKVVHFEDEEFLSKTRELFGCETHWFQLKYVANFNFNGPEVIIKEE